MNLLNYFHPLANLERQRRKMARGVFPEQLETLISHPIWPAETSLESLEYLVVDFETSGLDIQHDAILSLGWVVIKDNQIHLDSAQKMDVLAGDEVKAETAVINHIVPEALSNAMPISSAMTELLKAMTNRVIIAHSVSIERGFLNQYCRYHFRSSLPPMVWLDTQVIESSLLARPTHKQPAECGLSRTRQKYGLPDYPAHDALIDAVATAELFLAQTRAIFGYQTTSLGVLMNRSIPKF